MSNADQNFKLFLHFLNNSKVYFSPKGENIFGYKNRKFLGKQNLASIPEEAENAQLLPDNQTIIYTIKIIFCKHQWKTLKITDGPK